VLGRYRLRRRLGAGAFGTVWLAHDERLARDVAVKEIPLDDGAGPRESREALAAARLSHPGIVMLYEAGAEEGRAYLVSELVRGETLASLMAAGQLSDRDVLRTGLALCDALEHAHAHGVIHRDVKPSNVMVPADPERGAGIAKLTDFGVARIAGGEALTRTGDVVGTLAYMAPEQAEGETVTGAADLYALALVIYEALSGVNPVRAAGAAATARRLGRVLPSLANRRPDLPPRLVEAVDGALLPAPEERGTIAELHAALADALPHVSDEGGTIAPGAIERSGERSARLVALAARPAAGVAAGALTGAVDAVSGAAVPATAAAGLATLAVVALPRAGWLAAGLACVVALAASGKAGASILLVAVLAGPPVALWRRGVLWSLPALAPLLGLVGLAGAYPALAGRARSLWSRAALGGLGGAWLSLHELATGRAELLGRPAAAARPHAVVATIAAAGHGIQALGASGVLGAAAIWAAAAAVLPLLVRGRSLPLDVVLVTAWAAGTAAATDSLGRALAGAVAHPHPRGVVAGAVVAGVVALVAARVRRSALEAGSRSMDRPVEEPL
jgi:hypothetical protein